MEDRDTVLVVDDEEAVRQTFAEWLDCLGESVVVLAAADAEAALRHAHQSPIDLAILDWNLGSGSDGLQLLEDLYLFHPNLVAILVTGYAHQATPLAALRLGVRDYLDKNQDLSRDALLKSVRLQLDRIKPAKAQRMLQRQLEAFRCAMGEIIGLVEPAARLHDPCRPVEGLVGLLRFLERVTGASRSVLVYQLDREQTEPCSVVAVSSAGEDLACDVPWPQSFAGLAQSMQSIASARPSEEISIQAGYSWQQFEKHSREVMAASLDLGSGRFGAIELFDPTNGGFTEEAKACLRMTSHFVSDLLRQILVDRGVHKLVLAAIEGALARTNNISELGHGSTEPMLESVRVGLKGLYDSPELGEESIRLAESLRQLSARHGVEAVRGCQRLIEDVGRLLDSINPLAGGGA